MAKENDTQPPRRSRLRRWTRILILCVGLVLIVAAAPWLVAHTRLKDQLTAKLLPDLSSNIGNLQLSWFAAVELEDVEVADKNGQPLLEVARAATEKSLGELLWQWGDGAKITLQKPHLHCVFRNDGSNVEDAIQPLLAAEGDSGGTRMTLEVIDGVIDIADAEGRATGAVSDLDATCLLQPNEKTTATIVAKALVRQPESKQDASGGKLSAKLQVVDGDSAGNSVTLTTDALPLEPLRPILQRFVPDVEIRGAMTSDVELNWEGNSDEANWVASGKVDVADLQAVAPQWLGPDRLQLEQLNTEAQLNVQGDRLEVTQGHLESDLANLTLQGAMRLDAVSVTSLLADEDCHLSGRIDVAQLASQLPGLVWLKDDTQIDTGELTVELASNVDDELRRWQGNVSTTNLAGTAAGLAISWNQPVAVSFDLAEQPSGIIAGKLNCDSDFLQVAVDGSPASATLSARGDLDQLVAKLQQFVDLGEIELAGKINVGADVRRDERGGFAGNGHALLQDFAIALPGRKPIREQRMTITLDATGVMQEKRLARLDTAQLRVLSGSDRLHASLSEPVDQPTSSASWPLAYTLTGDLKSWLPRVESWLPLAGWDIRGGIDSSGTVEVATDAVVLSNAKATLNDLHVNGGGLAIFEPTVEVTTLGSWDYAKQTLRSQRTTMASSAMAAGVDDVVVEFADPEKMKISGLLAVRGELARLHSWISAWPKTLRIAGQLDGRWQLATAGNLTQCAGDASIKDLAVSQAAANVPATGIRAVGQSHDWKTVWQEENASFSLTSEYDTKLDQLQLTKLQVESKAASIWNTSGTVQQLTARPLATLNGDIQYDLETLNDLLTVYAGESVRLVGRSRRPFSFQGPLVAETAEGSPAAAHWFTGMTARASLGWDSIQAYGLTAGQGDLSGALAEGIIRFDPLDIAFTEGRLQTTPLIRLSPQGGVLTLSPESRIDQARITEQLCKTWFQYVAPLLANATRAEGLFSIELQRGSVPMTAPENTDLAGQLTIHSARVGPGPGTQKIVGIAQQAEAIIRRRATPQAAELNVPQQVVPFEVKNGRVHHQGFFIQVGDVVVRSRGSVGLDSSLALVAEIPIQDAWLANVPQLRTLQGQTLEVPIRGTLSKPKIDNRILKELTRKVAGSAAGGLIDDALKGELNKGLDSLFKRLQK